MKGRLIILAVSVFITMPMAGFLFKYNPIVASVIYMTQVPALIKVISEWYSGQNRQKQDKL